MVLWPWIGVVDVTATTTAVVTVFAVVVIVAVVHSHRIVNAFHLLVTCGKVTVGLRLRLSSRLGLRWG